MLTITHDSRQRCRQKRKMGVPVLPCDWLPLVTGFGRLFHRVAGAPHTLARLAHVTAASRRVLRFRPGRAALLGRP